MKWNLKIIVIITIIIIVIIVIIIIIIIIIFFIPDSKFFNRCCEYILYSFNSVVHTHYLEIFIKQIVIRN